MNEIKITLSELFMMLEDCRSMALFLSESVSLILEERSGYADDFPVPQGAGRCLDALADKINDISKSI